MYRLKKVDEVLQRITQRKRIRKVSAEDGMDLKFLLQRKCLRYEAKMKRMPTWVCLDWLGSVADLSSSKSSNERAMAWEVAANGGVKFAEESGIPTVILAQAVNDAQQKRFYSAEADRLRVASGRHRGCGGGHYTRMTFETQQRHILAPKRRFPQNVTKDTAACRSASGSTVPSSWKSRRGERTDHRRRRLRCPSRTIATSALTEPLPDLSVEDTAYRRRVSRSSGSSVRPAQWLLGRSRHPDDV